MTNTANLATAAIVTRNAPKTRPRVTRMKLRALPGYVFLSIWTVFSLFPLYFMVVSATNTSRDVLSSSLLPGGELVNNITKLFASQDVFGAMWLSFAIAVGTTVLALFLCSIAGYGFEVFHSKGKDIVMGVLLLAMMIPFAVATFAAHWISVWFSRATPSPISVGARPRTAISHPDRATH